MIRLQSRVDCDEGSSMVVAMAVLGICATLTLVVTGAAVSEHRDAGGDRQRVAAVQVAEAGIDATYAVLQRAPATDLPCTVPGSPRMLSSPDTVARSVAVQYVLANGTRKCPLAAGEVPESALITSTATTTALPGRAPEQRRMESLVRLRPVAANGFNRAIFSDGTLSVANRLRVNGLAGADADVYTNGDFRCQNNQEYDGDVFVQGMAQLSNSCSTVGDLWVKGGVTGSNTTSIGGRLLSSTGSVTLTNASSVAGTVMARGSISWGGCSAAGKCSPGNATVTAPPYQPLPILRGDAATLSAWQAQGFTVVTKNGCSGNDDDNPSIWLASRASSLTSKTLLRTSCQIRLQNNHRIKLRQDLAVFASGGIVTSNSVEFGSTDAQERALYLVVPYDAAPRPCSSPQLSTDNRFQLSDQVRLLVYSPCDISLSNLSVHKGQIYGGGSMIIDNHFTLAYRPLPVFGVDTSSLTPTSYGLEVAYKRERSPSS